MHGRHLQAGLHLDAARHPDKHVAGTGGRVAGRHVLHVRQGRDDVALGRLLQHLHNFPVLLLVGNLQRRPLQVVQQGGVGKAVEKMADRLRATFHFPQTITCNQAKKARILRLMHVSTCTGLLHMSKQTESI